MQIFCKPTDLDFLVPLSIYPSVGYRLYQIRQYKGGVLRTGETWCSDNTTISMRKVPQITLL